MQNHSRWILNRIFQKKNTTTTLPPPPHRQKIKTYLTSWNCRISNSNNFSSISSNNFSSSSSYSSNNNSTTKAFNRQIKQIQKSNTTHHIPNYSYFRQHIASRLIDRLDDILRDDGFPLALDVGCGYGYLYNEISKDDGYPLGGIGGIRKLVMMDSSHEVLHYNYNNYNENNNVVDDEEEKEKRKNRCSTYKLVGDEEKKLPFPDGTFDLVLSSTSMHWVNDLPGLWKEIYRVLKPDGCFLFAMVGGMTLHELNTSLNIAELERDGGVSPHVGPFVDFSDVGSLLSNAGFNLTTVDVDTVKIGYPNAMVLMEHLQRMGENNVSLARKPFMSADTFLAASCIYDQLYPLVEDNDGDGHDKDRDDDEEEQGIEATAQIIYGIGWVPHESQPQPKKRGSAKHKLGDVIVDKTPGQD